VSSVTKAEVSGSEPRPVGGQCPFWRLAALASRTSASDLPTRSLAAGQIRRGRSLGAPLVTHIGCAAAILKNPSAVACCSLHNQCDTSARSGLLSRDFGITFLKKIALLTGALLALSTVTASAQYYGVGKGKAPPPPPVATKGRTEQLRGPPRSPVPLQASEGNSFDPFNGWPLRMRAALLMTWLLLTGCTAAQRANIDDANCQANGAKFGTQAYVQCREAARQQ